LLAGGAAAHHEQVHHMLVRLSQQLRGEHHQRRWGLPMRQQRQQGIIWVAALKVAYVGGTQPCSRHVFVRRALLCEEGFVADQARDLFGRTTVYVHA
jgi:hypothetical protein